MRARLGFEWALRAPTYDVNPLVRMRCEGDPSGVSGSVGGRNRNLGDASPLVEHSRAICSGLSESSSTLSTAGVAHTECVIHTLATHTRITHMIKTEHY